ncbi:hypothetical protein PGTUg99_018349 [Puccinia graminis f. sp. tritici]|uniref:Uncharacterized protein n=1 Tax=Puccinia graminis f. sp. tritici TaxID=56615 RepID=A0A5B0PJP8_PUCGR|nr:hypothetical protein PGTUg99_018349 [Puccinia graminis f. sp. tritici]
MLLVKLLVSFQLLYYHSILAIPCFMSTCLDRKPSVDQLITILTQNVSGSKTGIASSSGLYSFKEDCTSLLKVFSNSQAKVLLGIMKRQEEIRRNYPTEESLEDLHNGINSLLAMLDESKKEKFWYFVEKNRKTLYLFPPAPVVSAQSESWLSLKNLEDIIPNMSNLLKKDLDYLKDFKAFLDTLEDSQASMFLRMQRNLAETGTNHTEKSMRRAFIERNAFLATLNNSQKKGFWKFNEKYFQDIKLDHHCRLIETEELTRALRALLHRIPADQFISLTKDTNRIKKKMPKFTSISMKGCHENFIEVLSGLNNSRQERLFEVFGLEKWIKESIAIGHHNSQALTQQRNRHLSRYLYDLINQIPA